MTDPYSDPEYLSAVHAQAEIEWLQQYFGTDGPTSETELQRAALLRVIDHEQDRADRLQGKLDEIEQFCGLSHWLPDDSQQIVVDVEPVLEIVRRSENG